MDVLVDVLQDHPWSAAAATALGVVIAALIVHRMVFGVLRRATDHKRTQMLHAVVLAVEEPAGSVLPLAGLPQRLQAVPDTLAHIAPVRHANGVLLIAAWTWLAMAAVRGVAQGIEARHPVNAEDNLQARRIQTQARILSRTAMVLILIAGTAIALMTFPGARHVGASLLASAGVLGIVGGLAARPVFANLIAGLQLALAQPLRIDDVLIVNGEYGHVEEITGTYVVLRLWDERRMIVPLNWFIENPFQNWTRASSQLLQTVWLHLDFATPMDPLRAELQRIVQGAPEWDKRVAVVQVVDTTERVMKVRILVSAPSSGQAFDLGCKVREGLLGFVAREYPDCLPRSRITGPEPDRALGGGAA